MQFSRVYLYSIEMFGNIAVIVDIKHSYRLANNGGINVLNLIS